MAQALARPAGEPADTSKLGENELITECKRLTLERRQIDAVLAELPGCRRAPGGIEPAGRDRGVTGGGSMSRARGMAREDRSVSPGGAGAPRR